MIRKCADVVVWFTVCASACTHNVRLSIMHDGWLVGAALYVPGRYTCSEENCVFGRVIGTSGCHEQTAASFVFTNPIVQRRLAKYVAQLLHPLFSVQRCTLLPHSITAV